MKASEIRTDDIDRARVEKLSHKLDIKMTPHSFVQLLNASLAINLDDLTTPSPPEMQIAKGLVKWLNQNKVKASSFIAFSLNNWESIRKECLWPDGRKSMLGPRPSLRDINKGCKEIVMLMESRAASNPTKGYPSGSEIYTKAEDVPSEHPQRKWILDQINRKGKAVLT